MIVIGVVVLIVIGPKELPATMRTIGRFVSQLRQTANQFRRQFDEAVRESEFEDIRREVSSIKEAANGLNPAHMIKSSLINSLDGLKEETENFSKTVDDSFLSSPAPAHLLQRTADEQIRAQMKAEQQQDEPTEEETQIVEKTVSVPSIPVKDPVVLSAGSGDEQK